MAEYINYNQTKISNDHAKNQKHEHVFDVEKLDTSQNFAELNHHNPQQINKIDFHHGITSSDNNSRHAPINGADLSNKDKAITIQTKTEHSDLMTTDHDATITIIIDNKIKATTTTSNDSIVNPATDLTIIRAETTAKINQHQTIPHALDRMTDKQIKHKILTTTNTANPHNMLKKISNQTCPQPNAGTMKLNDHPFHTTKPWQNEHLQCTLT